MGPAEGTGHPKAQGITFRLGAKDTRQVEVLRRVGDPVCVSVCDVADIF